MEYFCFLVAIAACIIGNICGMGGGVIIKPAIDAMGIMSVDAVSFLSGCTVLSMSGMSMVRSLFSGKSDIQLKTSSLLGVGAAVGGLAGKQLFASLSACFSNADQIGGIQALALFVATLATLLYTIHKDRIRAYKIEHPTACVIIGFCLGAFGSFLGIGGGPFNLAVLFLLFSMRTKTAAQNSLYIIFISQLASLLKTVLSGAVPDISWGMLFGMMISGIVGSEIGRSINRRLNERAATLLLKMSMVLVLCICVMNMFRFFL